MQQLPLNLRWPPQQRFDSFVGAADAVDLLRRAATEGGDWLFVSGASGSGKTHLAIAACAAASESDLSAQYLSLANTRDAEAIRAFGGSALLCVDDVQAVAGSREAEHALFDLYNRCRADKSTVIFCANAVPARLEIALPDLVSRLAICTQILLKPLDDDERRAALRQRAAARGLDLDDAVLDYLFTRHSRDLGSLTALLDRIDRESLASKRRVTVPFLRKILDKG